MKNKFNLNLLIKRIEYKDKQFNYKLNIVKIKKRLRSEKSSLKICKIKKNKFLILTMHNTILFNSFLKKRFFLIT